MCQTGGAYPVSAAPKFTGGRPFWQWKYQLPAAFHRSTPGCHTILRWLSCLPRPRCPLLVEIPPHAVPPLALRLLHHPPLAEILIHKLTSIAVAEGAKQQQ